MPQPQGAPSFPPAEPPGDQAAVPSPSPDAAAEQGGWSVGDRVALAGPQRYLKTADPMPMLRPPDLVDLEELGQVVEVRARGLLAVRFRRGTFLLPGTDLVSRPS